MKNKTELNDSTISILFILLCFLALAFALVSKGHCQVYENGYVKFTEKEWSTIRNNTINYYFDCEAKDSLMAIQDSIIAIQKQQIILKDSIITLYKSSLNSSENTLGTLNVDIKKPWIEWQGLYAGISGDYKFTSETTTFLNGLKYYGTVNARFRIDDYIFEASYYLPLSKESGYINLLVGARIF